MAAMTHFLFPAMPRGRVAVFRTIVYLFIFVDVFLTTSWVVNHGSVDSDLYQPLWIGEVLNLPTPTIIVVRVVQVVLLVAAAIAAFGKAPRVAGTVVFLAYAEWMVIAFSYGKVDHDRIAFLVALAVLPTVGRAHWSDSTRDEAAGFALRAIQLIVVATYFLSVFAKLRFGGIDWVNSATLMRAVVRRGTWLAGPLEDLPWVLQVAQYLIVVFELASPLLLWERTRTAMLVGAALFHGVTFATIGIIFLPHLICVLAFLPLERLATHPRSPFRRVSVGAFRRRSRAPSFRGSASAGGR